MRVLAAAAIAATLLAPTISQAAVTFVGAGTRVFTFANVFIADSENSEEARGESSDDTFVPRDLYSQSDTNADIRVRGGGTVTALADYTAEGIFTASGGEFTGHGRTELTSNVSNSIANASGQYFFSYAFKIDDDSKFSLDYEISDTFPFGFATNFMLFQTTDTDTINEIDASLISNTSGGLDYFIPKGYNYLMLISVPDIGIGSSGAGTVTGSSAHRYTFSISAVPEPATWALLIGGMGLAGVAIRRRRSLLA